MAFQGPKNVGAFVPTSNVWDPNEIYTADDSIPALKELFVRLYQNLNNISLLLNIKDTGYYALDEFVNSQYFFPDPILNSSTPNKPVLRQVYRTVVDFGALPNAATKSVAHNIPINEAFSATRIYGASTKPTAPISWIPLPYASTVNDNIELFVDSTNVNVRTLSNWSAWTKTYIIIEYLKF